MAKNFSVSLINNNSVISSVDSDKSLKISDLISKLPDSNKVVAVKINNTINSLDTVVDYNSTVEPIYINTKDGMIIYRRTLCLILSAAAKKLFPSKRFIVGHSICHSNYYTIFGQNQISQEEIDSLKKEMQRIIEQKLPIESKLLPYEDAIDLFTKQNMKESLEQLRLNCPPLVKICSIGDFADLQFQTLLANSAQIHSFDLTKYENGMLLRFPRTSSPYALREFIDEPKLFKTYKHYNDWGERVGVTSVSDLNKLIINRKINDFIDISETHQQKCIADIAEQIIESKKVRVVLIAGPSSSGKTTTSKKLALELMANGYKSKIISLDCYYLGRDKTPRDKNGELDFECLEALNIDLLNQNLIDLFDGKEVIIPSYDFKVGMPFFEESNKMSLEENEFLILEGIHGLNDKLTPKIPNELKFKLYISALTQLNLNDSNRISTKDNRLIRRIVRDAGFRGKSASGTIKMWPSVLRGEELHIYPFHNNADAILNTALDYELSVLRVYAEPILRCVPPTQKEYSEAQRLLKFLENFSTIPPTAIPPRSILREFIGGSAFKY